MAFLYAVSGEKQHQCGVSEEGLKKNLDRSKSIVKNLKNTVKYKTEFAYAEL